MRDRGAHTSPHGDPLAGLPEIEFPPAPPRRCAMCGNEGRAWVPVADVFSDTYPAVCGRCTAVLTDRQYNLNTRKVVAMSSGHEVQALLNSDNVLKVRDPWEDRRR